MSTAIAKPPAPDEKLGLWLAGPEAHAQIAHAVGDIMDPDQFVQHMLVAFQSPAVAKCSNASKATAILQCAALGLLPTLNQVVLIPYGRELKAMPQWQGYKALMERHPEILEVQAFLVHKQDPCTVEDGIPRHSYDPFDPTRTIESGGDIKGGYCKILYRNGRPPKYHFVPVSQIEKARGCAQTQNVWKAWYEQMALKTVYRDCYARRAVPVDPLVATRIQNALDLDDAQLGNDPSRASPAIASGNARLQAALANRKEAIEMPPEEPQAEGHEPDESQEDPAPESPDEDAVWWAEFMEELRPLTAITAVNQLQEVVVKGGAKELLKKKAVEACLAHCEKIRSSRGGRGKGQMFDTAAESGG